MTKAHNLQAKSPATTQEPIGLRQQRKPHQKNKKKGKH